MHVNCNLPCQEIVMNVLSLMEIVGSEDRWTESVKLNTPYCHV